MERSCATDGTTGSLLYVRMGVGGIPGLCCTDGPVVAPRLCGRIAGRRGRPGHEQFPADGIPHWHNRRLLRFHLQSPTPRGTCDGRFRGAAGLGGCQAAACEFASRLGDHPCTQSGCTAPSLSIILPACLFLCASKPGYFRAEGRREAISFPKADGAPPYKGDGENRGGGGSAFEIAGVISRGLAEFHESQYRKAPCYRTNRQPGTGRTEKFSAGTCWPSFPARMDHDELPDGRRAACGLELWVRVWRQLVLVSTDV